MSRSTTSAPIDRASAALPSVLAESTYTTGTPRPSTTPRHRRSRLPSLRPMTMMPMSLMRLSVPVGRSDRPDHSRGNACGHRIRGDVLHHHRVGADRAVVPDGHAPKDDGATSDVAAVFDHGELMQTVASGDAEGRVLADVDVVADGLGVKHHPPVVPEA